MTRLVHSLMWIAAFVLSAGAAGQEPRVNLVVDDGWLYVSGLAGDEDLVVAIRSVGDRRATFLPLDPALLVNGSAAIALGDRPPGIEVRIGTSDLDWRTGWLDAGVGAVLNPLPEPGGDVLNGVPVQISTCACVGDTVTVTWRRNPLLFQAVRFTYKDAGGATIRTAVEPAATGAATRTYAKHADGATVTVQGSFLFFPILDSCTTTCEAPPAVEPAPGVDPPPAQRGAAGPALIESCIWNDEGLTVRWAAPPRAGQRVQLTFLDDDVQVGKSLTYEAAEGTRARRYQVGTRVRGATAIGVRGLWGQTMVGEPVVVRYTGEAPPASQGRGPADTIAALAAITSPERTTGDDPPRIRNGVPVQIQSCECGPRRVRVVWASVPKAGQRVRFTYWGPDDSSIGEATELAPASSSVMDYPRHFDSVAVTVQGIYKNEMVRDARRDECEILAADRSGVNALTVGPAPQGVRSRNGVPVQILAADPDGATAKLLLDRAPGAAWFQAEYLDAEGAATATVVQAGKQGEDEKTWIIQTPEVFGGVISVRPVRPYPDPTFVGAPVFVQRESEYKEIPVENVAIDNAGNGTVTLAEEASQTGVVVQALSRDGLSLWQRTIPMKDRTKEQKFRVPSRVKYWVRVAAWSYGWSRDGVMVSDTVARSARPDD